MLTCKNYNTKTKKILKHEKLCYHFIDVTCYVMFFIFFFSFNFSWINSIVTNNTYND